MAATQCEDKSRRSLIELFRALFRANGLWAEHNLAGKASEFGYGLDVVSQTLRRLVESGELVALSTSYFKASATFVGPSGPDDSGSEKLRKECDELRREAERLRDKLGEFGQRNAALVAARDSLRIEAERLRDELDGARKTLEDEVKLWRVVQNALGEEEKRRNEFQVFNKLLRDELAEVRESLHAQAKASQVQHACIEQGKKNRAELQDENERLSGELNKAVALCDRNRLTIETLSKTLAGAQGDLEEARRCRDDWMRRADSAEKRLANIYNACSP